MFKFACFSFRNRFSALLIPALLLGGCTRSTSDEPNVIPSLTGDARLIAFDTSTLSQEEQLQRRIGQTEFLNPIWGHDGCGANCQNEPQQDESKQDQKREEQEADIFKIGEAGSKLLYLMNSYRGLQVVSFEDGAENPKLVGRAPSSGYSPNEMYLDEKHDRLIVVETGWYTGEEQTKLSVYDVTDSRRPKITQNVVVTGHVVDSRMVGNVLYVASRKADVGYVTSYSLSKAEITIVQQMKLSLKVSYQKNMNIVVSGEGAATKYYLIATLSEKDWSWWDDASIIEVVDITDPNGRIVPLMSAAARGRVEERTQTSIKNDTLIVTSNYRNKDQPLRIAVETFKLPTAGAEVIDQDEANYRLAHIERQLKGKSGVEYEKLKDKLLGDADLGLRGRFIRAGESLRKIVNDSIVTVGDGSGLHANLQDARYTGDLLYAFWVPQNEIDPFDIFDISHPENGIKHISRLQFDGWIDRAIPFTSQGRRFVLGLGWVVSVVDNEENRRQPQAMLFEVVQSGEKYKAVEIAQLSFKGSNIWADFNDQDKMIEVRFTADGAGEVLFGAQKYKEGAYSAGGQIVRFNANDTAKALVQGDFINGGADWIRRVFTNPEIDRLNTFSDRALGTYQEQTTEGGGELHPISILELARDVRAFVTMKAEGKSWGVQVIDSNGQWWDPNAKMELRLVPLENADAELSQVASRLSFDGNLVDQLIEKKSGDLLVLTNTYEQIERSGNRWDFTTIVRLMRVAVANGQLVKKSETEWRVSRNEEPEPVGFMIERGATASIVSGLVQLPNGDVFAQADSAVYRIDLASDSLSAQPLTLENCPTGARELGIRGLNGKTFLTSSALVPSENFPGNDFERRFISELALEGATGRCGVSVNVPGFPMVVADTGYIMSDDTWANNLRWEEYGGHPQEEGDASLDEEPSRYRYLRMDTHGAFTSVKFETDTATLTDTFDRKEQYGSAFHKISDSRIIRMESAGKKLKFESVDLTAQGKLLRIDFDTETDLTADYGSGIVKVARGSRGLYAAVRSGGKFEVFKILEDGRPLRLPLVTYNQLGEPNRSVMTANLASSWGWSNHYHFDFETNSFITSEGMFGVTRIKILD